MTFWQEFFVGAAVPFFALGVLMFLYGIGATWPRWISRAMANRAAARAWQLQHAHKRHREVTRQLERQRAFWGEKDALVRALASEATWLERFIL